MWKWLLSKFGTGPKAVSLPEAKTNDAITLFFGRFSSEKDMRWEFIRLPETLAVLQRVGDRVTELKIREDVMDSGYESRIRKTLRHYDLPDTTWVDRV